MENSFARRVHLANDFVKLRVRAAVVLLALADATISEGILSQCPS